MRRRRRFFFPFSLHTEKRCVTRKHGPARARAHTPSSPAHAPPLPRRPWPPERKQRARNADTGRERAGSRGRRGRSTRPGRLLSCAPAGADGLGLARSLAETETPCTRLPGKATGETAPRRTVCVRGAAPNARPPSPIRGGALCPRCSGGCRPQALPLYPAGRSRLPGRARARAGWCPRNKKAGDDDHLPKILTPAPSTSLQPKKKKKKHSRTPCPPPPPPPRTGGWPA